MKKQLVCAFAVVILALLSTAPAPGRSRRPSRKSPHAQIVAVARVASEPEAKAHKNQRWFLEFDITIVESKTVQGDSGADPTLPVRQDGTVHVVHDLSCGGQSLTLSRGDTIEIAGEYVHPPNGRDLIHFTHPADGSCGTAGGHPGGYIRRR